MRKFPPTAIVILLLWGATIALECHGKTSSATNATTRTSSTPTATAVERIAREISTARTENIIERPLKARDSFEAAIKLSETPDMNVYLADLLAEYAEFNYYRSSYKKAAEVLTRLKSIKPLNRKQSIMLAGSLYCAGQRKLALEKFREVYDLDSEQPQKRAIEAKEQRERLEESNLDGELSGLAYLYLLDGQSGEVDTLYEKAVQAASQLENAQDKIEKLRLDLARANARAGKLDAAALILKKELSNSESRRGLLDPATCSTRLKLAKAYLQAHRPDEADKLYQQLIPVFTNTPDEANFCSHLASFYWEANRLSGAADTLRKALKLREKENNSSDSRTTQLKQNLSTVLRQQGKASEAKQIESEISLTPAGQNADAYLTFYDLFRAAKMKEAIAFCADQVSELGKKKDEDSDRERENWLDRLGAIYCKSGDFQKARLLYEQKYRQKPLEFHDSHILQKIYVRLGQPEKAEAHLKEIITLNQRPRSDEAALMTKRMRLADVASAKNNLASFYLQRNQLKKSESVVRSALKDLAPFSYTPEANILSGNLSVLCFKQGRHAEAQRILESIRNQRQNDSYDDYVLHDPIDAFSTNGISFSSSGSEGIRYKTDSGESRIEPVLWRIVDKPEETHVLEDGLLLGELPRTRNLPMVDWHEGSLYCYSHVQELRALTKLALFNLYSSMHLTKKANQEKLNLVKDARAILGKGNDADDRIGDEYFFEEILKRLPESADVRSLEGALAKQRLTRAKRQNPF